MHLRWLCFGAVLLALGVLINAQESPDRAPARAIDLEQARLDLSFAELVRDSYLAGAGPEAMREAIAQWHTQHREEIELVAQERERLALERIRSSAPVAVPQAPPVPDGLTDEEFVWQANEYFRTAHQAFWGKVENAADGDEARDRMAHWSARWENLLLASQVRDARERIDEANAQDLVAPLSAAEIEALPPEEQIQEEMYSATFEVIRRAPLAEGEEIRDRLAEIGDFLRQKREELGALLAARGAERLQSEVDARAARLSELEQNN